MLQLSKLCCISVLLSSGSLADGSVRPSAVPVGPRSRCPLTGWAQNGGTKEIWGFLETAGGFCLTGELWELCGGVKNDKWHSTVSPPFRRPSHWSSDFLRSVALPQMDKSSKSFTTDEAEDLHESSSRGLFDRGTTVGRSRVWHLRS